MKIPNTITRTISNKRPKPSLDISDDETDAVVPICESKPIVRQSKSQPVSYVL